MQCYDWPPIADTLKWIISTVNNIYYISRGGQRSLTSEFEIRLDQNRFLIYCSEIS